MPVPRYGSQTRVGRSVQYQGGGGFMAGSIKDLAGAGLHSAIEYTQENVKVGPYSRLRTRVWLGETKSVKKAYKGALVHYISTYDVARAGVLLDAGLGGC